MHSYASVMRTRARTFSKAERQRLIQSIVSRKRIGTQHELIAELDRAGCRVTQATVSRDIRELRLDKGRDSLGHARFVVPNRARPVDPRDTLAGILTRFGQSAVAAENIVVVRSELGSAPAIARALDELEHPQIVGTLAGDDTCLVVAPSGGAARALAVELSELL
jgi:transcriptional regulator of arginine metabolism